MIKHLKYRMKSLGITLLFISCLSVIVGQDESVLEKHQDGPYIFYRGDSLIVYSFTQKNGTISIKKDSFAIRESSTRVFTAKPNSGGKKFNFSLFKYKDDSTRFIAPEKLLVVSDVEGNFNDMVSILQVSKVIDKKYNWIFGKNHLMVNGDLFDRGTDVSALVWLLYKLDFESAAQGGKVHINLGNHDEMNLRGNTSYVREPYLNINKSMGVPYTYLLGENTEMGRWLRTKNCIRIIDSNLFVHAGLSTGIMKLNKSPEQINQIIRYHLGKKKTEYSDDAMFLLSENGPLWYRGMLLTSKKYNPLGPNSLDSILQSFGVKRVIIGHTIVPEITGFHKGKVVAVDVDHPENRLQKKSRALLIMNQQFFVINDQGDIKELPLVEGFYVNLPQKMD